VTQAAPSTIELVVALSVPLQRAKAAQQLAAHLGVRHLLVYVRDPVVESMIPAPGFPQTVRGGPAWRALLARCLSPGRHRAVVDYPEGTTTEALVVVPGDVALVFVGGTPDDENLSLIETLLPMLAVALCAEQRVIFAAAEALEARDAASRARTLASALEAARAEGAKLNAELRDEHRRKDDFLAMLAHELRNPLTPLVTSIELLRRQGGDSPGVQRQLEVMARQVRQLSRLVEDLLDVSRVSRGRIELRRHRLMLSDVLIDAIDASRPLLDARRHEVTLRIPEVALPVNADNVRLTQVFSNLVHNAAKYTDPGGRIEVSVEHEGEEAVVRIVDNGIGIDPDIIPRVFDLFTQAPVSLDRAQGGLGIGLTLVRALVELHGGRVAVHSEGVGRGSTFSVRLPLMVTGAVAAIAPSAPRPPPEERSLRVLVVDDNEDAADSLADVLRLMGHHAEVAYSGTMALQAADDLDADLILLDIGLPEIDGYEVARRLRRMVGRDTRIVALTGYGTEEDKRRSREAGFDEHVVKPVMADALAGITQRACGLAPSPPAQVSAQSLG
jgi:signal transduction histidine kinase/CheY-like chemotaxis protein